MRAGLVLPQRRGLLAAATLWLVAGPSTPTQAGAAPTGRVLPRQPAPTLHVIGVDGLHMPLPMALAGEATAVQLMFTGCSSVCPVQGAVFAAVAPRLPSGAGRLLSISIDALGDTPASMAAWQGRLGPHPAWLAAVGDAADVDQIGRFMTGGNGKPGTHTAQVFVFDREARLCYRTGDAPSPDEILALLAVASTSDASVPGG